MQHKDMLKDQEYLRQAAYHEAGHAVVGRLYNLDIGKEGIYIDLGRDPVGYCDIERPNDKNKDEGYLRMLFAGRLAEEIFLNSTKLISPCLPGGLFDEQNITIIFDEKYPGEKLHTERFNHYNEIVSKLFGDRNIWETIEAVANALIEVGYMSENTFEEIISSKNLIKDR